ncbi:hypothetical protein UYO_0771 [Lachnospiraceae bacterium JC7]|nr:hypothetical protein UYO_0771 [Lachnospiraceae bacterium JC7]
MFMGILCVTALLSLLAMLVFGEFGFSTFFLFLLSVGGIVLKLLASRLPVRKLGKFILAVFGIAAILTAYLVPGAKKVENSTYDFANRVISTEKLILTLDEKAEDALTELEKDYGESDRTYGLRAYLCMTSGENAEAYNWLNLISDKTSQEYYTRLEALYMTDPDNTDPETLYRMYKDAVRYHPDWGHMQCMTGIAEYEKGNLNIAKYHLNNALNQDPHDCYALYYLGAIACKWGDYTTADKYFRASMENGATEQMLAWMTMNMKQAG